MVMWKMKSCPRCGKGDIYIYKEENGWYEQCLQCSYRRELKTLAEAKPKQPVTVAEPEVKKAS